jgi:hypothetical protein
MASPYVASRSHWDTSHSVGLLWTSDQPDSNTSTWQYTTLIKDRYPCHRWDSNPQSQQASGRRPTARPLGTVILSFITKLVDLVELLSQKFARSTYWCYWQKTGSSDGTRSWLVSRKSASLSKLLIEGTDTITFAPLYLLYVYRHLQNSL